MFEFLDLKVMLDRRFFLLLGLSIRLEQVGTGWNNGEVGMASNVGLRMGGGLGFCSACRGVLVCLFLFHAYIKRE